MSKLGYYNNGFYWKGPEILSDIPEISGFAYVLSVEMWYSRNPVDVERMLSTFPGLVHVSERVGDILKNIRKGFVESNAVSSAIDVPSPEGLEYMPFQKAGIDFITSRYSTLLADEQGLGKTIQVIGTMNIMKPEKTLILCPATLKLNWKKEIERWSIEEKDILIVNPGRGKRAGVVARSVTEDFTEGVLIINYDLLQKHAAFLIGIEWDLVVMDEAHYIKNDRSIRAKIARKIQGKIKILATGTPILNRPLELYSLISYLDKEKWPSKKDFINRYCDPHTEFWGGRRKLIATGASNLEELQYKLRSTMMIRRLKKDVLKELPDKRYQVVELEGVRLKHEKDGLASIGSSMETSKIGTLGALAKLRHDTSLEKVPKANKFIEDALESGEKIVVFAHHKDVIDAIYTKFKSIAVKITGDVKNKDRQKAVEEFQENPDVRLFIGNMIAAGTGITLTKSSHVIFVELDWVPGIMAQAEDRCHRIGQKGSVLIQYLVVQDSIDAKLAKSLVLKQGVINQAVNTKSIVDDETLEKLIGGKDV